MSSVDERIVQMRFDNAQFESGVRQTLSSLDKLKQGLKFNAAINGANVLQNAFNGIKLNGINNSVDQLNRKFSSLGIAGMEIVKRVTNDVLNSVTRVATAIPNQIKAGGWARALNLENAQFQLKGLGVTWDKINNDIQYAVNGTAYGLDSAAKVAGQLAASNIEVSDSALTATKSVDDFSAACIGQTSAALKGNGQLDEMATALRSISGVAAMSNSSFEEIGQIYTRVAGQGRVMADDLNSIASRGLNAAATLGKYLGKTESEVRDMVSKGQIDFKTFSDAMYDAYADQAVKANNTFQGALSNTKSALSRIGADVADDLLPALTKILNSCRLLFNQVHKWIQPVLDSTGKLVSQIGDTLSPIIDAITAKIAKITGIAGGPIEQIAGFIDKITAKVKGVGNDILSYFGLDPETAKKAEDVAKSVDSTVTASVEHITEMAKRVIHGDFGNEPVRSENLEAIGENFEVIQNKVNELLGCSYRYKVQTDETTSSVNEQADAIKQTTLSIEDQQKIMRRNTVMNFFKGFENIGKTISLVFTSLGSSITNFFSTLTPPDWSKFSSGFAKATGVIVNNADRIKEVKQVIDDIVFSIGNTIEAAFQVIGTLGKAIVDVVSKIKFKPPTEFTSVIRKISDNLKLSQDSANGLHDIFVTLLSPLKLIVPLIQNISLFVLKMVEGATALNKKFLEFVGKSKILKSVQKIFESIGDVIKKIFDGIKDSSGFQKFIDSVERFATIIGEKLGDAFDKLAGWLEKISGSKIDSGSFDGIINGFSTFFDALSKVFDTFSDLIEGKTSIKDVLIKLGQSIKEGAEKLWDDIRVAVQNIDFKQLGTDIKTGLSKVDIKGVFVSLKDNISKAFSKFSFKDAFKGIGKRVSKDASDTFKEESTGESGLENGLENGLELGKGETVGAAIADSIKLPKLKLPSFEDIINQLGGIFEKIKNWLAPKIADAGQAIKTAISKFDFGKFIKKIWDIFTKIQIGKIIKGIADVFSGIGDVFKNAGRVVKNVSKLIKAIADVPKAVSGFINQMKKSLKHRMAADTFKAFATGVLELAGALMILSMIKVEKLGPSVLALGVIMAGLVAVVKYINDMELDPKRIRAVGIYAVLMGVAILAIAEAIKKIAGIDMPSVVQSVVALGSVIAIITSSLSKIGDSDINFGKALGFAIAIGVIVTTVSNALANLAQYSWQSLTVSALALSGTIAAVIASTKLINSGGSTFGQSVGYAVLLGILISTVSNALANLAQYSWQSLTVSALALSGTIAAVIASTKLINSGGSTFGQSVGYAVLLGILISSVSNALGNLAQYSWQSLTASALALSGTIAAVIAAISLLSGGINIRTALTTAFAIGSVLGTVAIIFGILLNSIPDPNSVLPVAAGLSVALIAVAAALRIMGGMGADIAGAVSAGASIGLAIDTIALCIEGFVALNGVFAKIPGFEKTITDGLRIIKKIMVGLGDAFGSAAGAFVGGFTKESSSRISDSMDAIQNIVTSMENMADSLSGTDFGSVLTNVRNLKKSIKELGKISIPDKFADKDKVSDMRDQFKSLTNLVHYIADNLSDIDGDTTSKIETLTDFIDNLKSFAKTASSNSFKNANNISSNMDELSSGLDSINAFCTKLGNIKLSEDDVTKVENLSKIIKTLSSSAVTGVGEGSFMGLKGLIMGIGTFSGTASDIAGGVNDLNYFFSTMSGIAISDDVVDKVTNLSRVMTELESSTTVGVGEDSFMGLKGLITGIGSFSGTASDIAGGVNQLNYFFSTMNGINIDDTIVDKVSKLSSIMTELESSTSVGVGSDWPGLKAFFTGISSFSGTSTDLEGGIIKLQDFFSTLSGITIDDTVVDKVTKLSSMMTQMESATSTGVGGDWPGLKAFFTGISSFSGTAEDLAGGVDNIVKFASKIGSVTISDNAVSNVEQIKQMMNALNGADIQETGGLKQFFTGVKDFSKYAEDLSEFSSKIQEFSNNISSISGLDTAYANMQTISDILKYFSSESGLFSADAYANVTSIVDGEMFSGGGPLMKFIKSLSDQVIPALNDIKQVNTSNFESAMSALKKVASMSADIQGLKDAGFDSISRGIKRLASALTDDISGIDTGSVDSFVSSIQQLGTIDTSGLSTIADSLNNFVTNGIGKFKSGIQNANVTSDINSFIGKVKSGFSANAFDSAVSSASSAGKNIGSKFADALVATKVKSKGASLGKAAIKGIKSVVGQAGPIGTSFGQKFAAALQSSAGIARSAGLAVGQNASNGLRIASSYAYTSGVHFAQNFANGIHAGASAAVAEAQSIASRIKNILGHTTPKEGPMKDDDIWGKHFAENFATGIDEASGTVVESASNMANSVWDVVSKLNAQGKKSADDLAKSVSSTATKYLAKAKETRDVTYKEILLYWDKLLDNAKQNSAALLEENGNVNDVIYKSAEQFISDHKERIDEYVTDEESLWKKVISLTDEGSDARQNAIRKYNDALVSDPENYITKMIKEYGEENVNQTEIWVKALKTASEDSENVFDTTKQKIKENLNSAIIKDADNNVTKYTKDLGSMAYETRTYYDEAIKKAKELGATEATLNILREKAGDAELSFAEEDLSRIQTYYDMSNTQQALYWKAMLSKVEEGTSAYSKIEEKFFSARNAAWNEYTNAVQSTISSLQSQLSLSSEFKFEEPKFDIFENQKNIESGLKEYTSAMDKLESRSILTAENLKKIRETFGVKDLGMIEQLLDMSDGKLSSFNDSMTRTNELTKSYAENVNQNLKPNFLYTNDEITEISKSAVRVMQTISDVAGDKQWVESVATSMENIAGTSAERTSDEKTQDYINLGHNLMDGTIRGITERSSILASEVASAVARAIEAARAAAQVHSPSKKMMKIGSFMGEGLIIGMKDWVHSAGAMGKNLGNTALSGMDYMMAALASDINDNMDMQPVIRPVIDMSDVTSSANAIDSMLSSEQAMRVAAGYDSLMASRQNGSVGSVTNDNSVGSINVNIYPTENQNANDISDAVIKKLNNEIIRKRKVYA